MKNKILLSTGLALALVLSGGVYHEANAVTANGTADAIIVAPIVLTAGTNLDFGILSVGAAGGTAVVNTAGVRSVTGDVVAQGGTPNQGTFNLYGDVGYTAQLSIQTSPITLTSGANTMSVGTFTMAYNGFGPGAAPLTGVTLVGVTGTNLNVGGTLTVGASQAAGAYTGTFVVVAVYE